MLNEDTIQEFLDYELEEIVHPILYTFFTRDEIRQNLRAEVLNDIEQGSSNVIAQKFQKQCFVENTDSDNYKIRYFEPEPRLKILAGIRFRGLDMTKPYVAILHRNFPIQDAEYLKNIIALLKEEFKIFKPKAILFHQSSHIVEAHINEGYRDKQILIGGINDISNHTLKDPISIELAQDSNFYGQYSAEYDQFHTQYPDRADFARAESKHDIESYVKNDLVYLIKIHKEFGGVFIVTKSSVLGAEGYYVIENFLFKDFRGKGFAPQAQTLVAKELVKRGGKVLFGSIYPNNFASFNAAKRSGRVDIGGSFMIPII